MDIKEIIKDLEFPSELSRNIFIGFYEYLQDYMFKKETDPDNFDKIDYFQNSNTAIVKLAMDDYVNIFIKTLLEQHEKIISKWRIWNISFRKDLSVFFRDFTAFEVYKRNKNTSQDTEAQPEQLRRPVSSTPVASSSGILQFPLPRSKRISTITFTDKNTFQQKDTEAQPEKQSTTLLAVSSTPVASSSGIIQFPLQRLKRVSPSKPENLNEQTANTAPSFSQFLEIRSPVQRATSPMDVREIDIEEDRTNPLLSNIISNQTEPRVNASIPLTLQVEPAQAPMPSIQQIEPVEPVMPLTPSETSMSTRSTEPLIAQRPVTRARRKKIEYDVMTEDRPIRNLKIDRRNRDWDPFDIGAVSNLIGPDLPFIEVSRSGLTPIEPIRIDSSRFDELFNEIEILDEEIDLILLAERREYSNYLSTEPSTIDLLMPDLPRVSELRNLRENLSSQPTQNIFSGFEERFRSMQVGDLNPPENELHERIVTSAILHKSNLPVQDLEILREEISPLADLPQSSPDVDNINQITIDNQNDEQLQQLEAQNLIGNLDQNIAPVEPQVQDQNIAPVEPQVQDQNIAPVEPQVQDQNIAPVEPQVQDQNEIAQTVEIPVNYQNKHWLEILRVRKDTPVNLNALFGTNKRKRRKRRVITTDNRTDPIVIPLQPAEVQEGSAQVQEGAAPVQEVAAPVQEEAAQVGLRGSLDEILDGLNDFDQANVSLTEPENQLPINLENQSEAFKAKFIKWKESYLASNPQKYQKYLKISIENVTRDARSLADLRDIFERYTLSDADAVSSTELLGESSSSEGRKNKKRLLKGLSEAEIIEFLDSITSDEEEMT